MGSVIVAMPRTEDANSIAEMLNRHGMMLDTEVCQTASEVLRTANDRDFGVVICTRNLKDMSCVEMEEYLPPNFGMIILTKDISMETYSEKTVKLQMPFKTRDLMNAIESIASGLLKKMKQRGERRTQRSAIEQRIIDDAKKLLMETNGMTEPEAFRYVQKTSMDTGRNMIESARMILALYQ